MDTQNSKRFTERILEEFKGISAQGYCTGRNAHKEVDSSLLEDIERVYNEKIVQIFTRLIQELKEKMPQTEDYLSPYDKKYDGEIFFKNIGRNLALSEVNKILDSYLEKK